MADAPSLNPANGLTIGAWVLLTGAMNNHRPVVSKDSQGAERQYLLTITDENRVRAHVGITNGNFYYTHSQSVLAGTNWYHLAMTYSAAAESLAVYINSVLDTNVNVSGSLVTSAEPVFIGGVDPTNYWWGYWLDGLIDEVDVFDRALSGSEIQGIYNAGGAGKFNPQCVTAATNILGWWPGDGHPYDLARTNTATLQNGAGYVSARVAQGFSFDGADDYVEIPDAPDLNPTNGLTVEAFFNGTAPTENQPIFSKDNPYTGNRQYLLTISDSGTFRAHLGTHPSDFAWFDGTTVLESNAWYHVPFRGCFAGIKFLTGLGELGPGFEPHDAGAGGMGDARQARHAGKVVLFALIGEAARGEHALAVGPDEEQRGGLARSEFPMQKRA